MDRSDNGVMYFEIGLKCNGEEQRSRNCSRVTANGGGFRMLYVKLAQLGGVCFMSPSLYVSFYEYEILLQVQPCLYLPAPATDWFT
jgi:hypothetical protein